MASSIPEGTVFLIPMPDDPPAMGVVARRQPRGHCVALYVYARARERTATGVVHLPEPHDASYRGRFADQPLRTGEWPVLGIHPDFKREEWPFDEVVHRDAITGACQIVRLDDKNPLRMLEFVPVDCSAVAGWPSDDLDSPYLFVKEVLPRLRDRS